MLTTTRTLITLVLCAVLVHGVSAQAIPDQVQVAERLRPFARQWDTLLAGEDSRFRDVRDLQRRVLAIRSANPELLRISIRALGRTEDARHVDEIGAALRHAAPEVRAAAAHALVQAARNDSTISVRPALLAALQNEADANVRAALLESIGRARHRSVAEATETLRVLRTRLDSSTVLSLGAARGLHFLARQQPIRAAFDTAARTPLRRAARRSGYGNADEERIRTVAVATLALIGTPVSQLHELLADQSALVRREVVGALANSTDTAASRPLLRLSLTDPSPMVRLEAVRAYARRFTGRGCDEYVTATRDANAHVSLLAIDLIGTHCRGNAAAQARLDELIRGSQRSWHGPAHALVARARLQPEALVDQIDALAQHENFFARAYAAQAAALTGNVRVLRQLAADAHPIVRKEAVDALHRNGGHAHDSIYIAQLSNNDSQLLMSTAAALEGSKHPQAVNAMLSALARVTALKRETSRDGRVALLERIGELGTAADVARLRPYLRDFDPNVARLAAEVTTRWRGEPTQAAPQPLPRLALPTFEQAAELASVRVIIEMANGDTVEMKLLPFEAPTNAFRFARLARAGYFNGLTFHRIAPNFVVQGGSPNANEYAGDGPFTRDEVGVPNNRGTVGLSTRGRDTGDAQIYFNLIDNVRLDHDYTVFAVVTRGMDAVDRMLEGAVIGRVSVVR